MSKERSLNFKWILIGAGVIAGIHFAMHPALAMSLGGFFMDTMGLDRTMSIYAYRGTLGLVSFFVGGLIVGWLSPGETLKEPAIAGVVAAVINNVRNFLVWPDEFNVLGALVGLGVGFFAALAGAIIGEKLQGDTTDKMRERGELPPTD